MRHLTKIRRKDNLFVLLVAGAFWFWISGDMVFSSIGINLESGKLVISVIIVLVLLFLARVPKHIPREQVIPAFRRKSIATILLFLLYCTLHAVISGTEYSLFKLQQLYISIIVAYALSYKVIHAFVQNKILFLIVGFMIGLLTYYTVFSEMKMILETETVFGLRAMNIGVLGYQDYYVVLFLVATSIFFTSNYDRTSFSIFGITAVLCLPIIIGFNSRMIPFTVGGSLLYLLVALKPKIIGQKKMLRNVTIIVIVGIAGMVFIKQLIHDKMALMTVFIDGPIQTFYDSFRYLSFGKAAEDFLGSPLFGIGFGRFSLWGDATGLARNSGMWAHNIFFELLGEMGLIGFMLFANATAWIFLRVLYVRFGRGQESLIFFCAMLVYVAATMQLSRNIAYSFLWVGIFCSEAGFVYQTLSTSHSHIINTA